MGSGFAYGDSCAGNADFIVTHNIKDFTGAERFDVRVVTPGWLLKNMGGSI